MNLLDKIDLYLNEGKPDKYDQVKIYFLKKKIKEEKDPEKIANYKKRLKQLQAGEG